MKTAHGLHQSFVKYIFALILLGIIGLSIASCGAQRYGCAGNYNMSGYHPKNR